MAWTRTVAQEWARHKITVNAIVPAIWTPMYDAHRARMSDAERTIHDGDAARDPLGGASAILTATWPPSWCSSPATAHASSPARQSRWTVE
jgi:NAD(P)-dependent dehydrogenase (short-subunit alcohol dehydrogenase family)